VHPFAKIGRILRFGLSYLTLFEWMMIVSLRWVRQQLGHRFGLWTQSATIFKRNRIAAGRAAAMCEGMEGKN
jgi:hypothetical protein